jgi:hypothetical protein
VTEPVITCSTGEQREELWRGRPAGRHRASSSPLVADREVRVINNDGELLAEFTIDPPKTYQTQKRPRQRA